MHKPGAGYIAEINNYLFEGRYSPVWPDGKKHSRNVCAHTRKEYEEKLKVLIVEIKAELTELKKQKAEIQAQVPEDKKTKKTKKGKKSK